MIQRIQSVYLSLIALLTLSFFFGSFLSFSEKSGSVIGVTFNGIFRVTSGQNPELIEKLLPLSGLIVIIPLIAIIAILLYNNRKMQMKLTIALIALIVLLIIALVHVSFSVIAKFDAHYLTGIKMIIPVLMLVSAILAYLGIRKDDHLVKSYDRLR